MSNNDVLIMLFDIATIVLPKLTPREKSNGEKIESEREYQPLLNNIARFSFYYFNVIFPIS
jgi:hypothetical protein